MISENDNEIIIYKNGEIELNVSINDKTLWLRQNEISKLFEKDRTVITRHINNILKDNEVDEKSNVQKMHFANSDKPVNLYSLDIILAVGYRTNSAKAIKFRQWATKVLKQYIYNGYTINSEKITNERFVSLEKEVSLLRYDMKDIKSKVKNDVLEYKQGIFYDGQIFDAYVFVADLIKSAKSSIILVDNFVDETVLMLLSKRASTCKATIYTKTISKQLQLDLKKHNEQYPNIEIKKFNASHDRFLIIDKKEIYHIGSSLKDLGKKWFGFSKMDKESFEMIGEIEVISEKNWIKNKCYYSKLNESKIKHILYFGLIWSIFEDEVYSNSAQINKSSEIAISLSNQLETSSKGKITRIWNYFLNRYVNVDGSIKQSFTNFKFNNNDGKQFVIDTLQKQKTASYQEKAEAIMRIIFRLRNNLLHGQKDVSKLYEQNSNFKNANLFLMLLVDKQIRIN